MDCRVTPPTTIKNQPQLIGYSYLFGSHNLCKIEGVEPTELAKIIALDSDECGALLTATKYFLNQVISKEKSLEEFSQWLDQLAAYGGSVALDDQNEDLSSDVKALPERYQALLKLTVKAI